MRDHRAPDKPKTDRRWGIGLRLQRKPPFVRKVDLFNIGASNNPMMCRWRLVRTPYGGLYVHYVYREDLDPVPHDHPWWFWSWVLRGGYREEYYPDVRNPDLAVQRTFGGLAYSRFHRFPLTGAHRITAVAPGTMTLVLVGPKVRSWGFYTGGTWVDWEQATAIRPTEGARGSGKYPTPTIGGLRG